MSKTIRDVTFELLRELGITTIFGNPGSTEETFLQDFPEDFQYIKTLQEASAVGAADGYAQATGTVGLVNVHTAAGLSNTMSNIFTASMNKTPLIITAGNQTREMLLMEPWLTNVDPENLPKPFVKWSYQPKRAEDVPAAFMRAYAAALQPPAGPVFLSIPLDDWNKEALEKQAVVRTVATRVGPDPERLMEFVKILEDAKNPVLIYGSDIARENGWDIAVEFAERLDAPVWAAPSSERSPFPENHPLYVGGLPFATHSLAEKIKGHDVALIIGAPVFRYYPYEKGAYLPDGLRLLHVTNDPYEAAKAPVGDSLIGDSILTLSELAKQIKKRPQKTMIEKQPHRLSSIAASSVGEMKDSLLTPLGLFEILRKATPKETILVEESPSNLGDLHKAWSIEGHDLFYTAASGSLGWSLPASVGIALGERSSGRNRPVLTAIGDGSLQYSIQGLWTAAQHKLPILFVVPVNQEYGILKSFAEFQNNPGVPGLNIPGLNMVSLADGYGCYGVHTGHPQQIEEICKKAFEREGPTVLSVPIVPTIPPLI